jgi:hypothetical protein
MRKSNEVFDELASEMLPSYGQRGSLLFPAIELAKQTYRGGITP